MRKFAYIISLSFAVICLSFLSAHAGGKYEMRGEKMYKDGKEVNAEIARTDVTLNGKDYSIVITTEEMGSEQANAGSEKGLLAVFDGDKKLAEIPVCEYEYFFEDESNIPQMSPNFTRFVRSAGTSYIQTFTIFSFPELKKLAQFDGYYYFKDQPGLHWEGEDKIFFDADGGYDNEKQADIPIPSMIDLKTGKISPVK